MFGYMTDLRSIAVEPECTRILEAEGVDMVSLLFAWLDGCLSAYGADYFVGREVAVTHWGSSSDGRWKIRAVLRGERFEFGRHTQGTEVKAMTYSNMQIFQADGSVLTANDAVDAAAAAAAAASASGSASGSGSGSGSGSATAAAASAPEAAAAGSAEVAAAAGSAAALAAAASTPRDGARKGVVDLYLIVDI
jgi:SHS2 domain-containing protein